MENLELTPYRVRWIRRDSGAGMSGWSDYYSLFATEAEAVAAATVPFKAGVYEAQVDRAENVDAWATRGRWRSVGKRKRKEEFKRARNH